MYGFRGERHYGRENTIHRSMPTTRSLSANRLDLRRVYARIVCISKVFAIIMLIEWHMYPSSSSFVYLSLSLSRSDRKQTRRENLVVCVSGIDIDGSR